MAKLSPEINEILNFQISHEMQNILKYKLIASFYEDKQLKNIASKFHIQAEEEFSHFNKIIDYINTRLGGKYIPIEIITPIATFNSFEETGEYYLDVEVKTTESLEKIAEVIYDTNSFMDYDFINEMLKIQITEEDEADEFLCQIKLVRDIVLFDKSMEG